MPRLIVEHGPPSLGRVSHLMYLGEGDAPATAAPLPRWALPAAVLVLYLLFR